MRKEQRYGWHKDEHDGRDFKLAPPALAVSLPSIVDLRPSDPPVYNQGGIGSCTANAAGDLFEAKLIQDGMLDFVPSRLFIYYCARDLHGASNVDSGAQIRDVMKVLDQFGTCGELDWPYDIVKFNVRPPAECYDFAKLNRAISYQRIDQNLIHLKSCLASGFRFALGIQVFESFESDQVAKTGMVPMPGINDNLLGGHAIACVGYDDTKNSFLMRNSWGPDWGLGGYFYLPYQYIIDQNLGSDFWTIRSVD